MGKSPIHHEIVHEIYTALEKLGADPKLLGVVGSWGDTLDDAQVLDMLKTWNATGDIKLDSSVKYTPSFQTDVRKTFARIRREQQAQSRQKEQVQIRPAAPVTELIVRRRAKPAG
jgi:hypothetical protein